MDLIIWILYFFFFRSERILAYNYSVSCFFFLIPKMTMSLLFVCSRLYYDLFWYVEGTERHTYRVFTRETCFILMWTVCVFVFLCLHLHILFAHNTIQTFAVIYSTQYLGSSIWPTNNCQQLNSKNTWIYQIQAIFNFNLVVYYYFVSLEFALEILLSVWVQYLLLKLNECFSAHTFKYTNEKKEAYTRLNTSIFITRRCFK